MRPPILTFLVLVFHVGSLRAAPLDQCQSLHEMIGYHHRYADKICAENRNRKLDSSRQDIASCVLDFQNLTSEPTNLDVSFSALCFHGESQEIETVLKNTQCLKRYDALMARHFLLQEDVALMMNATQPKDSLFKHILNECKKASPAIAKSQNEMPSLYSRTVFHSLTPAGRNHFNLGGLSGITMDSKENLYAVSDDRNHPNLSQLSLLHKPKSHKKMEVILNQNWALPGNYTDLEDIALDTDGNFIVTSEEIPGRTFNYDRSGLKPKSYIFKIGSAGEFLEDLPVPESFFSKTLELDALCGKKEETTFVSFFKELFTGAKRKTIEKLSDQDRSRCAQYAQTDGIRYNRGIESLSLDHQNKILYYTTEQPLMKKNSVEKNVSLVAYDMQTKKHTLKSYPQDDAHDSGVVGLLKVKNKSLLVLERGYNPQLGEAVVKLYKTAFSEKNEVLDKTLLIDFKNILSSMPRGLHKVDNFEGLTLGPWVNGNPTIIFVSDNNLSLKQKTDFLILEVPKAWLE